MKYLFFLALLCSACKQTSLNCTNFKTGTFVLEGDGGTYKIERTADMQTETDLSTGVITKCNIKWLDNCSYVLTFRHGSSDDTMKVKEIKINFLKTAGDYVYFESYAKEYDVTITGKMRKVK